MPFTQKKKKPSYFLVYVLADTGENDPPKIKRQPPDGTGKRMAAI